ncbi:3-Oxoacyl (acyl-carrier protein) reductase [Desulfatibacillum aliphaticivorans]|uniref:3-oxoacyl-[acyl-carrier-protein] reductase n=1 Tax=Desulfatibacillum aliphaticivorans TaxID=218208 RepID=B8FJ69_DESAL|nr:3-oxoacyl-[acyl-carrier-protein] reductase [Desulfatibacillum aliphaticivorans]ACL04996.1 3-Oxoacyl (acyl-carrier protein) reductase [Desulfatibacillum aliphaticivorans]
MDTESQVVVVTGGSQGIGRAIALRFAGQGASVYFCHYDPDDSESEKTEKLLAEAGGQGKGFKVNVADKDEVKAFFKTLVQEAGRIDVLVNNAGVTKDGFAVRMKEQDWDLVVDINLKGTFFCTQEAARAMMKQKQGRIINISSVVGAMGNPTQANYAASKAGVIGLTKAVAKELASRGILVNAVAPGYINTQMTDILSDEVKQAFIDATPLGKMGEPEDVAAAVEFLASENSRYITGQVLHVNGGMYM